MRIDLITVDVAIVLCKSSGVEIRVTSGSSDKGKGVGVEKKGKEF